MGQESPTPGRVGVVVESAGWSQCSLVLLKEVWADEGGFLTLESRGYLGLPKCREILFTVLGTWQSSFFFVAVSLHLEF